MQPLPMGCSTYNITVATVHPYLLYVNGVSSSSQHHPAGSSGNVIGAFSNNTPAEKDEHPGPPLNQALIVFSALILLGTNSQKLRFPVRSPLGLAPSTVVDL